MIEVNLVGMSELLQANLDRIENNVYEDFEAFFVEATLSFHEFPRQIREAVNTFIRSVDADGALLLRGLPTDADLPPTPSDLNAVIKKRTQVSEFCLCSIASMLGEPVSYLQERKGAIIHNMYPTRANASNLSSDSSSAILGFHTEMAYHPFMPDYLLLYGLRQDPKKEAVTSISSVTRIIPKLTDHQKNMLFQPLFKAGIDYSFGSVNGTQGNGPLRAILYGNPQHPYFCFDHDLMLGITEEAQRVLEELREIVYLAKDDVLIEPGSLLALDNRRCVHARSIFTAYYNGQDRWLQRMLVSKDITRSYSDRVEGGRMICTDFSQFFK